MSNTVQINRPVIAPGHIQVPETAQPAKPSVPSTTAHIGTDTVRVAQGSGDHPILRAAPLTPGPLPSARVPETSPHFGAELSQLESEASEPSPEDETIPLPAFGKDNRLNNQDCRFFMQSQLDAAQRLAPHLDLSPLQAKADAFDMPTKGHGKIDSDALKKEIKAFTAEVKHALKAEDPALAGRLEPTRHEILAEKGIWSTGYEKADSVGWNKFSPLASLAHVRDSAGLQARTCHAHTTDQPINAWKTSYGPSEGKATGVFYRNGSFAPQPSKLGEKWSHDEKQAVANQRAETMVKSLISDYIASHPGKPIDHFTFSNLNLLSRFHGETKLSEIHRDALKNLDGRSFSVTVNGQAHQVQVDVRTWRQDIKDAGYLGTNKEMRAQNNSAMQSLDKTLARLAGSGKVPPNELRDMQKLRATIGQQLQLQEVKGITRVFETIARGIASLAGSERVSPRMDPSEVSALMIALESKIAEHEPGAVSEGCKSGKDRGSIVDASAKALLHEMAIHNGQVPDHVLKPGWMLTQARNDEGFRNDLHDIFLANYDLQKANTGFKGYITNDLKVLAGGQNYIEKLSDLVFEDKKSIKAGSGMIKS